MYELRTGHVPDQTPALLYQKSIFHLPDHIPPKVSSILSLPGQELQQIHDNLLCLRFSEFHQRQVPVLPDTRLLVSLLHSSLPVSACCGLYISAMRHDTVTMHNTHRVLPPRDLPHSKILRSLQQPRLPDRYPLRPGIHFAYM